MFFCPLLSLSAAAVPCPCWLSCLCVCGPPWAMLFAHVDTSLPMLPKAPITRLFVEQTFPEGLWEMGKGTRV